jgi:hypothetical protein
MSMETLTDFLREPKRVLKQVDKEDVVLARRGKAAIRISLDSRVEAQQERSELAAHLLADAVALFPAIMTARMTTILEKRFPWVRLLPTEDRAAFTQELVETMQACASVGKLARIEEIFHEWKATAEIYADPELAAKLKGPFAESSTPVRRP